MATGGTMMTTQHNNGDGRHDDGIVRHDDAAQHDEDTLTTTNGMMMGDRKLASVILVASET